jgi:hypothetical protein
MKLFNLTLVLLTVFTFSCASLPEKKQIDFFEDITLSKKELTKEIQAREDKITELKQKIQTLKNYNDKFISLIDLESSYNKDVSDISRAYAKNKEIIAKNEIQINKLESEIRMLTRKKI